MTNWRYHTELVCWLVIAFSFLGMAVAKAETPAQYEVKLTAEQAEGIINAGAACLEKVPYACARYTIYIHDLITKAKVKVEEPK